MRGFCDCCRSAGGGTAYTPSDVSVAMVLVAREAALSTIDPRRCHPLVCDLASADDLPAVLAEHIDPADARLITFFGMIPNFEPQLILPRLAGLLRPSDYLLFWPTWLRVLIILRGAAHFAAL